MKIFVLISLCAALALIGCTKKDVVPVSHISDVSHDIDNANVDLSDEDDDLNADDDSIHFDENDDDTPETLDDDDFHKIVATFAPKSLYEEDENAIADKLNKDAFVKLVENGVNLDAPSKNGMTALMFTSSAEVMTALIQAGADVNARDHKGHTALMHAGKNCIADVEDETVNPIVESCLSDLREFSDDEEKFFEEYHPCLSLCGAILIRAGADVNASDDEGRTPLMSIRTAVENYGRGVDFPNDTWRYVDLLIRNGADVNARDHEGKTPLMYANDLQTIQTLLDAGADLHAVDDEGKNVLFYALDSINSDNGLEILEFYIEQGLDPNATDNDGKTLKNYAASMDLMDEQLDAINQL